MPQHKTLVVFYSRSGRTRKVAEAIANALECDIEEIQDVRSRKGLFGWLRSGYEAATRKLPPIRSTVKDPGEYDLVIIGSPVWGSTMASPVRSYLTQHKRKLINNVALFCTMGGQDSGHTIPDIGLFCQCDALATLAIPAREVTAGRYDQSLARFLSVLKDA
jgi:flavodoxin